MYKVDLNSDLGESFGRYTIGNDDKIIPLISSANIACGFHASDPVVMTTAIEQTKEAGIQIGAHPGFPDLMKSGRFSGRSKSVYSVSDQRSWRYVQSP